MNIDVEKLKELQKQMQYEDEYDNDVQASPRFWVVGDYRWVSTWDDDAEKSMVFIPCHGDSYDINELIESEKEEGEISYNAVKNISEVQCDITALDWIHEYIDSTAYLVPVRYEHFIVPNTLFLTKKDAREHIVKNKHHYSNKVHTYAMTGWRSESYDLVWNMIMNIVWDNYRVEEEDL